MKRKHRIAIIAAGIIGTILLLLKILDYKSQNRNSVGIIGGADGPTVIYLSSGQGDNILLLVGTILILAIVGVFFLLRKKRK